MANSTFWTVSNPELTTGLTLSRLKEAPDARWGEHLQGTGGVVGGRGAEDGAVPAAAERNRGRHNLPVWAAMRDVSAFLRAKHQLRAQRSGLVSRVTAADASHGRIFASNLTLWQQEREEF